MSNTHDIVVVGAGSNPGGAVTLGGRATAMKMLMDWKIDLKKALSASDRDATVGRTSGTIEFRKNES